ncbi:hypothetical protein [Sulfuricurvum sp.]|uniref:hypothetical protein n=1 Tax=Sulfuricurvum sp. TaxID=2025608 RepID=UPI002E3122D2|nr:hypothetical protein [Sulfuricurvum sp.]HEX5329284.1 hypothetical protein [Sulfuricurvum sp.]
MYAIKRKGFAMILAIFVVVLIAMGGTLLLSNASMGSKTTFVNYLRAEAELLAQSATDYTLMRAQAIDTTAIGNPCLNQLNITVNDAGGSPMFDIRTTLTYSFRGARAVGCTSWIAQNTGKDTTVMIDVTVSDHNLSTETIRVHKRSWQKL